MAFQDVRAMLALARDGASIDEWRSRAAAESRLLAGSRRITQLRIATTILRPQGSTIRDDGFLSDLHAADDAGARDLVYARYLASVPIAVAVARVCFREALTANRAAVTKDTLDAVLEHEIPDCAPATRARTRTAIISQFGRAGVVRLQPDGALSLTHRQPAALAIFHLLKDELRERREASEAWITTDSLPAALFAIDANAMQVHIDALVSAGRLQRSYYAGRPRILAA
jgi:hypothetical protein